MRNLIMLAATLTAVLSFAADARAKHDDPDVPAALAVPDGNKLHMDFDAVGVQIYQCRAAGWAFVAPEATLYDDEGNVKGTHYVGPTWEGLDGTTVVGAVAAKVPAPDSSAIPWLLLRAVSHAGGDGRFSEVTYIQRLDTMGGIAPTTGCDASTIGTQARVPYTAHYFFYIAHPAD